MGNLTPVLLLSQKEEGGKYLFGVEYSFFKALFQQWLCCVTISVSKLRMVFLEIRLGALRETFVKHKTRQTRNLKA